MLPHMILCQDIAWSADVFNSLLAFMHGYLRLVKGGRERLFICEEILRVVTDMLTIQAKGGGGVSCQAPKHYLYA